MDKIANHIIKNAQSGKFKPTTMAVAFVLAAVNYQTKGN